MTYTDLDVENGNEYCYLVKTSGYYNNPANELINFSQVSCTVPKDNQKPCPPELSVSNYCDQNYNFIPEDDLFNYLKWIDPSTLCDSASDVASYKIYFSSSENSDFGLLFEINNKNKLDTSHLSVEYSGCYYVTAVDENGNESDKSNIVCAKSCPLYVLPNTFTPNNDGQNDIFHPIYMRHISHIDLKIYNKLGVLVFETSDREINWKATDRNGNLLKSDTYYYICTPFTNGSNLQTQSGFIELIR